MTREELRAEIAMAICMVGCGIAAHRSDYFGEADAALAALEAEGVRLVPAIPTWPMIKTAQCSVEAYDKMIALSPYAPPGS
jgi:hypothetical protein